MTDTLKLRMGELDLGDLAILDAGDIEGLADNPINHPLNVDNRGAAPRLLYRDLRGLNRENGPDSNGAVYELNLGAILADGSADKALLSVEIQVGEQVIVEDVFQITLKPILSESSEETETLVDLDTGSGLPEDEFLEDVGDIDGAGFSDPAIEIL